MSTHADTIQYTNQAIQKVDELINSLAGTDTLRNEIEACLRAAFEGTDLETAGQMHQMLGNDTETTLRAAVTLKETLQSIVERIQATS